MIRMLARKILFEGKEYDLSLVEISDDKKRVCISPFGAETYSTVFIPGTLLIEQDADGTYFFREL